MKRKEQKEAKEANDTKDVKDSKDSTKNSKGSTKDSKGRKDDSVRNSPRKTNSRVDRVIDAGTVILYFVLEVYLFDILLDVPLEEIVQRVTNAFVDQYPILYFV